MSRVPALVLLILIAEAAAQPPWARDNIAKVYTTAHNIKKGVVTDKVAMHTYHMMLRACALLLAVLFFPTRFFRVLFAFLDLFSASIFSISSGLEMTELLLWLLE